MHLFEFFGTIKRSGAAPYDWYVLNDATHQSQGIAEVLTFSDHVEIVYDADVVSVGYGHVTPDEAYVKAPDVKPGNSCGLSAMWVYFYMGTSSPVNPRDLSRAGGNFWVSGKMWVAD